MDTVYIPRRDAGLPVDVGSDSGVPDCCEGIGAGGRFLQHPPVLSAANRW